MREEYAIELKLDGTRLCVSLTDGSAWGAEISGDSIDLAPAFRAVLSELEAERDRLRTEVDEHARERRDLAELVNLYAQERAPEAVEIACRDRDEWVDRATAAEAERDRLREAVANWDKHAMEMQALAGAAEAERDRLRDALERVLAWAEAVAGDNRFVAEAADEVASVEQARAALKGDTP